MRIGEEPEVRVYAEPLRDGRVAVGTRTRTAGGDWRTGEIYLLDAALLAEVAGWLTPLVVADWIGSVRGRQDEPVRTAEELYGDEPDTIARLAREMMERIPPELMRRAMILLANSLGPASRSRLVEELNRTRSVSTEAELRRRLDEESEAFGYAIAAASLFDALLPEE